MTALQHKHSHSDLYYNIDVYRTGSGGEVSSLVVTDQTGSVEITLFNEQSKQLHQIFKDGSVYNITHLKPQVIKDSKYKRGTSNYNLIAQTKTSAFLEDDDSQIPFKTVNTTKFSSLEEKMGDKVNILGIVTDYTDPITIGDYIKKRNNNV